MLIAYILVATALIFTLAIYFFYRTKPSGFHITSKKLACGIFAGLVALSMFVVAAWMLLVSLQRRPDIESLAVQANELISRAGGAREICDEANRLFKTYSSSDDGKIISASNVTSYPAISDLLRANVRGHAARLSLYGPPVPRIYLHVGGHIDGYSIVIVGSSTSGNRSEASHGVNLENSCIFVE